MGPWWVNAIAGIACIALGVNFIAQAYGLRLGGKPLDTTTLPTVSSLPITQNNPLSLPEEYRHLRGNMPIK